MSVVVGLVTRDKFYMAADTQITSGDGHIDYDAFKIYPGKNYLMGVAGDYKVVSLMEYFNFTLKKNPHEFLVRELPLMIKSFLEPYNITSDKDDKAEYSILIAHKDGLCEITDEMEASIIPVFHAIGTGAPYAFGAYHASIFEFDSEPEHVLKTCVGAAIRYNAFCGGDIIIESMPD